MTLHQKRSPFGSVTFTISDTMLRVEEKKLLNSRSFEVPLREIGGRTSTVRQFPLLWLLIAVVASGVTALFIAGIFTTTGDSRLGMMALVLMCTVFTALAWHGFVERKIDFVILHARESGHGLIFIHRTKPTPRHVEEFVEIVKERCDSSRP